MTGNYYHFQPKGAVVAKRHSSAAMTTPNPRALLRWLALAAVVSRGWADSSNVHTFEAYDEPSFADEGKMADEDDMARTFDLTHLIFPGTKYCGQGNISDAVIPPEKYLAAEDACCKAHDECTHYIDPGKTDPVSGLSNECYLSQSDCTCEDTFFKCLKTIGSRHSNMIGSIYFSGLARQCFKKDIPVMCKTQILFWNIIQPTTCQTCLNYCTDTSAAKAWHWRPTANFHYSDTAVTQPPPC